MTIYRLTAANSDGQTATKSVTINVLAPKPAISYFEASPNAVKPGERVDLCYSVFNGASARIEPDVGGVKPAEKNCVQVFPKRSTSFSLTVLGAGGQSVTKSADVKVIPPQPPPRILYFNADPAVIYTGQQTKLCYGLINAISAGINPELGAVKPVEKDCLRVAPRQTTTYTITATGHDSQKISKQFTIEVKTRFSITPRPEPSLPPRVLFFTASHKVIAPGKSATLCYGVANASSAYINPGVGDVKPVEKDCRAVTLKETTTYTLVAKSADGRSDRQAVTVRVESPIK
jgi:hypothetical protein